MEENKNPPMAGGILIGKWDTKIINSGGVEFKYQCRVRNSMVRRRRKSKNRLVVGQAIRQRRTGPTTARGAQVQQWRRPTKAVATNYCAE